MGYRYMLIESGPPNKPPTITCPTLNTTRPEKGVEAVVTWKEPVGRDEEDGEIKAYVCRIII